MRIILAVTHSKYFLRHKITIVANIYEMLTVFSGTMLNIAHTGLI